MRTIIALLRGVNVGGHNKIVMAELKDSFQRRGFQRVITYINSGNIIFDSDIDESVAKAVCERLIAEDFGLDVAVCIIAAADLREALAHAPDWWNKAPDVKHNAFFVIPPISAADICARVGAINEEHERVDHHGRVIFWSAPAATFSRTRWSKMISTNKVLSRAITVRNANTALKLAALAGRER